MFFNYSLLSECPEALLILKFRNYVSDLFLLPITAVDDLALAVDEDGGRYPIYAIGLVGIVLLALAGGDMTPT